jgi:valyl-tRNA synthetase
MRTAVSDLEVVSRSVKGKMYTIKYHLHISHPLSSSSSSSSSAPPLFLLVATTRPETIFGDVAVAVNPLDCSKSHWLNCNVTVPLTNRHVPVIADAAVDMTLGTGALKVTPAHDFTDFEVGRRHSLPHIVVIDKLGNLCGDHVPPAYNGVSVSQARLAVVQELRLQGLLLREEDIEQTVPHVERTGVPVEPVLTTQWFIDSAKLVPAVTRAVEDAVNEGSSSSSSSSSSNSSSSNNNGGSSSVTHITPSAYTSMFFDWMKNIQPWCISRQIWWGHRIPAFYSSRGDVLVEESLDAAEAKAIAGGVPLPLTQVSSMISTDATKTISIYFAGRRRVGHVVFEWYMAVCGSWNGGWGQRRCRQIAGHSSSSCNSTCKSLPNTHTCHRV